ncbi:hypothetical protein KM043_018558 [Ampulex compressa]|nr:hypothetical protein KM043_018558 [Ampulex compressa]
MNKTEGDSASTGSRVNGYDKNRDAAEIQIPVPWGHISGKWWGPRDMQPIVALHGWQDNAGSYDTLAASLLPDLAILCIDLPGHGYSSHLPIGEFYYVFWDGVLTLRRIVKHFKWAKVKLLGHSLGGAISFLYAASFPDEVDALVCLDIASPSVKNPAKIVEITGDYVDKFLKYETLTNENMPCYEYEEMIDIVEDAYTGSVTRESAKILMKRGMQSAHTANRYYFSRDPRLKVALLGSLSMDLVLAYAARIKCSYLNIRAVPGLKFDEPENYHSVLAQIKTSARKYEYHEIEGTHHVHMNNPERVAPIIINFLST